MKTIFFAITLISFVFYNSNKTSIVVPKSWDASYRTITKSTDVRIKFIKNNRIELFSNDYINTGKAIGTYKIDRNNKIAITCAWPGEDSIFVMNGSLSNERKFVKGEWKYEPGLIENVSLAKNH